MRCVSGRKVCWVEGSRSKVIAVRRNASMETRG